MMLKSIVVAALLLSATPAFADWAANHPRRVEVNQRLANQNARIRAGVRDGQLSYAQARQPRREDRAIRSEERAFAAIHHGHITPGEQRLLNRQENAVSRQIYRERHY